MNFWKNAHSKEIISWITNAWQPLYIIAFKVKYTLHFILLQSPLKRQFIGTIIRFNIEQYGYGISVCVYRTQLIHDSKQKNCFMSVDPLSFSLLTIHPICIYYGFFFWFETSICNVSHHLCIWLRITNAHIWIFTMVTYFLRWTLLKFFSSFPDEQSQQKVR